MISRSFNQLVALIKAMNITNGTITYNLTQAELMRSPYLSDVFKSKSDSDKSESVKIDCSDNELIDAVNYLRTGKAEITSDNYGIFYKLGFTNKYEYDLDYFTACLRDQWKMVYPPTWARYGTYKNPLRSSVKDIMSVYNTLQAIEKLCSDVRVYVHSDTVFRLMNDKPLDGVLIALVCSDLELFKKCIRDIVEGRDYELGKDSVSFMMDKINVTISTVMYPTSDHLVHSFNIDCLQVCWDGSHTVTTKRCKYAMKNSCNWFNPNLMSSDYIDQLMKYAMLGFKVRLPLIEHASIPESIDLTDMCKAQLMRFHEYVSNNYRSYKDNDDDSVPSDDYRMIALRLKDLFGKRVIDPYYDRDPMYLTVGEISGFHDHMYSVDTTLDGRDIPDLSRFQSVIISDREFMRRLLTQMIQAGFSPELSDMNRLLLSHIEGVHVAPRRMLLPTRHSYSDNDPGKITFRVQEPVRMNTTLDKLGVLRLYYTYMPRDQSDDDGLTDGAFNLYWLRHEELSQENGMIHTSHTLNPYRMNYNIGTVLGSVHSNVRIAKCCLELITEMSIVEYKEADSVRGSFLTLR